MDELSQLLALAPSTLRQHLTILAKEGLVLEESVREGVGRPHKVYRLAPEAERLFPKRYAELLQRILRILTAEDYKAVDRLSKKILEEVIAENRHLTAILDPKKRLEAVVQVLIDLGSVWELNEEGQVSLLKIYDCPFSKIVPEFPQLCQMARTLLVQLTGAEVQLIDWMVEGSPHCTFQISHL